MRNRNCLLSVFPGCFLICAFLKTALSLRPTPFLEFHLCPPPHGPVLRRLPIRHVRCQTGHHSVASQPGNLSSAVRYRNTCIFLSHVQGSLVLGNVTPSITVQLHHYGMRESNNFPHASSGPEYSRLCSLHGPTVSPKVSIGIYLTWIHSKTLNLQLKKKKSKSLSCPGKFERLRRQSLR